MGPVRALRAGWTHIARRMPGPGFRFCAAQPRPLAAVDVVRLPRTRDRDRCCGVRSRVSDPALEATTLGRRRRRVLSASWRETPRRPGCIDRSCRGCLTTATHIGIEDSTTSGITDRGDPQPVQRSSVGRRTPAHQRPWLPLGPRPASTHPPAMNAVPSPTPRITNSRTTRLHQQRHPCWL